LKAHSTNNLPGCSCPTDEILTAIIAGSATLSVEIDEHIQGCATCQDRLSVLSDQSDLKTTSPPVADFSPAWRRVREFLKAHPPVPEFETSADYPEIPGYEIKSVLGRGVTSVVYAARELALSRLVAIKLYHQRVEPSDEGSRFHREKLAVANLHHPHVVQLHSVGEYQGRPYLVLEYAEGASLADRLDGQPWPPRKAAELVCTLANTVSYAHDMGIIHRDLKPANVVFTEGEILKIADFGLSTNVNKGKGNKSGFGLGTPGYTAPEQLSESEAAEGYSQSVDVYSLGAILYELLTGRPPFRASRQIDTIYQTIHQSPVPPRRLEPGIPLDLEVICLKCLEKKTASRYQFAGDLADELRRFLVGEPIMARPGSMMERVWKLVKRHPVIASGLMITTVLLATTGILLFGLWQTAEKALLVERDLKEEAKRRSAIEKGHAREAQKRNAQLQLDQAIHLCDQGEVAEGTAIFSSLAPQLGDRDPSLMALLRRNRSAWERRNCFEEHRIQQAEPLVTVAINPDGSLFALGKPRGFTIWEVATGEARGDFHEYGEGLRGIGWSRSGGEVAAWGNDGIRVWDSSGRQKGHFLQGELVDRISSLPSDHWLAVAGTNWAVFTCSNPSGMSKTQALKASVREFGILEKNNQILFILTDGTLARCCPKAGQILETANSEIQSIEVAAVSSGGKAVVAGGGKMQIFSIEETILPASPMMLPRSLGKLAISDHPFPLIVGFFSQTSDGDCEMRVWEAATGIQVGVTRCENWPTEITHSVDGKRILVAGKRRASLWLNLFDKPIEIPIGYSPVNALAISKDGRVAIVGRGARNDEINPVQPFAQVWRLPPDPLAGCSLMVPGVRALEIDHEGHLFMADKDGLLIKADPSNPGCQTTICSLPGPVRGLLLHPEGDFILAACDDTIHILNPSSGAPIRSPIRFKYPLRSYSLSHDGRHLAIGGRWNQYAVWDTGIWRPVNQVETLKQSFGYVGFLANGAILAGELNGKVSIREAQTGKLLVGFQLPCTLNCAALSPDGNTLAVGSMQRGLRLVDSMTGSELLKPFVLPEPVVDIVWHPDGHSIFARNSFGVVRQFDTATMKPIGPPVAERASSLVVSREGKAVWLAHPRHVTSLVISDD